MIKTTEYVRISSPVQVSVVHRAMASPMGSPTTQAMRRKRGAVVGENSYDDSSSSSRGADSMRPVALPRKRRRTILNAFQSISLQNNKNKTVGDNVFPASGVEFGAIEENEDADSSQAVAAIGDNDYDTSSLEDGDNDVDDRMLSDKEKCERKVMLELVFGPGSEFSRKDPVDLKIQQLIRGSMQGMNRSTSNQSQDDMNIEPVYSRTSPIVQGVAPGLVSNPPLFPLKRSNSLPDMVDMGCGSSSELNGMDTS